MHMGPRMGRTVFGAIIFAAFAAGCAGKSTEPLTPDELTEYQDCAARSDCVLVANQPATCGCGSSWTKNPAAVARDRTQDLYDAFENDEACPALGCPEIAQPFADQEFRENRYAIDCVSAKCSLTVHENVGDVCGPESTCPQGHDCRTPSSQTNGDATFCFFVGGASD